MAALDGLGVPRCEAPRCRREARFRCDNCGTLYCSEWCRAQAWDVTGDHALECAELAALAALGARRRRRSVLLPLLPLDEEVAESTFTFPPTAGTFNVQLFDQSTEKGLFGLGVQLPVLAPVEYRLGRWERGYMYEVYGDGQLIAPLAYVEDTDAENALFGSRVFRGRLIVSLSAFAHVPKRERAELDADAVDRDVAAAKRKLEAVLKGTVEADCSNRSVFEAVGNAEKNVRQFELRRRGYDGMQSSMDGELTLRLGALPPLYGIVRYELRQGGRRLHVALREAIGKGSSQLELVRLRFFLPLKQAVRGQRDSLRYPISHSQ